jgi:U3 small nucleolar RNA-associated protein 11
MYRRTYRTRKQVEHRKQYGRVEKRKELVARLAKIKEQKKEIRAAKEEIRNKSGQEYFFAYNSLRKENGKVCRVELPSADELRKTRVYIDSEITRYERKMQGFMARPLNKHIRFDGEETPNEDLFDYERGEKERAECRGYIDALRCKRAEVCRMLEEVEN